MNVLPVDVSVFLQVHAALGHVKYGYGAKAVPLSVAPGSLRKIDCSGYARYLVYHGANRFQIPDGSYVQRKWFEENGLPQIGYDEAARSRDTLCVAFYTAGVNGVGDVGHVLFLLNGRTYESYGGNGVGSLRADNAWRKRHVHKVFVYPTTNQVKAPKPFVLYQSNGALMADLPVFNGRSYVPARHWAQWHGMAFHWDAKTGRVYYGGKVLEADTKVIDGHTYVPFAIVAQQAGISYQVDNEKHEIRIVKPGARRGVKA